MKNIALIVLAFGLILSSIGFANTIYDDFSGDSLDLTKWSEIQNPEGQPLVEEHYVDQGKLNYHTANINNPDRRIVLNLIGHTFLSGESLEYDVDYISGEGNRASVIYINGGPLDRLLGSLGCNWCGSIGLSGQEFDVGNEIGLYHVRLDFVENGINLNVIRPDSSLYTQFIPITTWNYAGQTFSSALPWNIGVETWSNGAVHFDYDNFTITTAEVPSTLEERVEILEQKVNELEKQTQSNTEKIGILETSLNNLIQTVNDIGIQLNDFISEIINYLSNLPKGLRVNMICGALMETNETSSTGLGLYCKINDKGACTCKNL